MKKNIPVLAAILLLLTACAAQKEETVATTSASAVSSASETENTTTSYAATTAYTPVETTPTSVLTSPLPETQLIPEDYGNDIVRTAEGLIGIPFAKDGSSPAEGFDNSGFIYYVLRENGYIGCPRQISTQIEWGETTESYDALKPGDVVYFSGEEGEKAEFGGIYAGGGIMIYSPFPGEKVKKADITTDYWVKRFVTALSL